MIHTTEIPNRETTLNSEDVREIAEILRTLPEGHKKALHGVAMGMKMSLDIETEAKETA